MNNIYSIANKKLADLKFGDYQVDVESMPEWCTDSEACFDLQVKYGLSVYVDNHPQGCRCIEVEIPSIHHERIIVNIWDHDTVHAATRYAIVLAVIELLKSK